MRRPPVGLGLVALALGVSLLVTGCPKRGEAPAVVVADVIAAEAPAPVVRGPMRLVGVTRTPEPSLTRDEARVAVTVARGDEALVDGAWIVVLPAGVAGARPLVTGVPGEALSVPPGTYDVRVAVSRGPARQEAVVTGVLAAAGERVSVSLSVETATGAITLGSGADPASVDLVVREGQGGRLVVRAPADRPLVVPPGDYVVDVVLRDSTRSPLMSGPVRVSAGGFVRVDVPGARASGHLVVVVEGINGTGALTDGVTVRAVGQGADVVLRAGEAQELEPGEYLVTADVKASVIAVGSSGRTVRVGASGTTRITITVPVAIGWVRAIAEAALPDAASCTTAVRAKTGLAEAPLGAWIAVPAGEVDLSVRCGDARPARRLPGLLVEGGERQEHRVRW